MLAAMEGKLQTLPRPTAAPAAAIRKPKREENWALGVFMAIGSLGSLSDPLVVVTYVVREALIYVASDERLVAAGTETPEFTRQ
ncbi:hypothetical protein GCM10009016_03330 [Halomonas beimenensis]